MNIFKWAVILSGFWLLLSGYLKPLLLFFGVVSVALVLYVLHRMDSVDKEPATIGSGTKMFGYVLWLFREIIKSSLTVTKLIWGSSDKLSPSLAKVSAGDVPETKRVLYANSITLTPGTLSVDLEGDELTVHALQGDSLDELEEGDMEQKISGVWGDKS